MSVNEEPVLRHRPHRCSYPDGVLRRVTQQPSRTEVGDGHLTPTAQVRLVFVKMLEREQVAAQTACALEKAAGLFKRLVPSRAAGNIGPEYASEAQVPMFSRRADSEYTKEE